MDNAAYHTGSGIIKLLEEIKIPTMFLGPYYPKLFLVEFFSVRSNKKIRILKICLKINSKS